MMARCMLLLVGLGCGWGQAETTVTTRLKAELKEVYAYVPPVAAEEELKRKDEAVFELEPMVVTRPLSELDVLAEARRAAEAKQAEKFSALRGGSLIAFKRGEIGFWPTIVPTDATPVKKADVALRIDLLRIKW